MSEDIDRLPVWLCAIIPNYAKRFMYWKYRFYYSYIILLDNDADMFPALYDFT